MSGNPTLSLFSGWNEVHGGSMDRNSSLEMGQSGAADRRSRVLQSAPLSKYAASSFDRYGTSMILAQKKTSPDNPQHRSGGRPPRFQEVRRLA